MNNKLEEKLRDALGFYGADLGFVVTDTQVQKLLDAGVYEEIPTVDCNRQKLANAIMTVGKVLQQSDDGKAYIAAIGSGVGNMNVAMAAIELDDDNLEMLAVAREGLIKQQTAKKAISRVQEALIKKCQSLIS